MAKDPVEFPFGYRYETRWSWHVWIGLGLLALVGGTILLARHAQEVPPPCPQGEVCHPIQ